MSLKRRFPVPSHRGQRSRRIDPNRYTDYRGNTIETDGKGHSKERKQRLLNSKQQQRYLLKKQRQEDQREAREALV